MLHFDSDYMEGTHPVVLERLVATNLEQTPGYGSDAYCEDARHLIREACGCPDAAVYFAVGGTPANMMVLDQILRPWEGVISTTCGHINTHEAGAIEALGHKVLTVGNHNGKLFADEVRRLCQTYWDDANREHMLAPGVLYLTQPSEFGTLYTLSELDELSQVCKEFSLRLFVDGARLGYGLAAPDNDITLKDLARYCDVFYIGGTKVGALFGEAIVFPNPTNALYKTTALCPLDNHFFSLIKKRGGLLAKGRLLGIQFSCLFEKNQGQILYETIGRCAVEYAQSIAKHLRSKGYEMLLTSPTNQQFVVVDNDVRDRLARSVSFDCSEPLPHNRTVIRFATSWATTAESVEKLIALL